MAFGVSVLGSVFLVLMFNRVVAGYFSFHGIGKQNETQHDQADIELEDWAARLTDDDWKAFLDRLPDKTECNDSFISFIDPTSCPEKQFLILAVCPVRFAG